MNMKKHFEQGMLQLLETKSIDNITVGELIEVVGSSKGTFYKYYDDKYSLCCSCLKTYVYSEVSVEVDDWSTFVLQGLAAFERRPKVVMHAFDSKDFNSARNFHEEYVTSKLFSLFKQNAGIEPTQMQQYTIKLYSYAVTTLVNDWLKHACCATKDSLLKLICSLAPHTVCKYICPEVLH